MLVILLLLVSDVYLFILFFQCHRYRFHNNNLLGRLCWSYRHGICGRFVLRRLQSEIFICMIYLSPRKPLWLIVFLFFFRVSTGKQQRRSPRVASIYKTARHSSIGIRWIVMAKGKTTRNQRQTKVFLTIIEIKEREQTKAIVSSFTML